MTAETDLLPVMWRAPKRGGGWMYFDYDPTHLLGVEPLLHAHAIAPLQAEIEALRAEVAEARDGWHMASGTADLAMKHRDAAEARAERLAKTLRDAADDLDRGVSQGDVAAHMRARAALEQEGGNG